MSDRDQAEWYVRLFLQFSSRVESYLLRIAIVLAVALLMGQLALRIPSLRERLSKVDRLEGVRLEELTIPNPSGNRPG